MKGMILVLSMLSIATGCKTISPDAGQEAVMVKKPWLFSHGGVDRQPIKTGLTIAALTTDAVYVSMQPIQNSEHFDDLMSSDGVPLDFDAVLRLRVTDSVTLIEKFGPDWYKSNVEAEFRNRVRQAVRKHGMNETAIKTEAIDSIDAEISAAMEKYFTDAKLPVTLVQVTVGKANPPDSIKNQRVETAKEQQRILTESQRKLAEDSRKAAELSRADADNSYRNAMQLNPDQFLKLESIKMMRDVCAKGGCSFITTSGSGVTPIVDTRR